MAGRAQGTHRAEGRQVTEVVAGEQDRRGLTFGGEGGKGGSLVHSRRAQLDDQPSRFERQPGSGREVGQWVRHGGECGRRVGGASRVHGQGAALVLDAGAPGCARLREQLR